MDCVVLNIKRQDDTSASAEDIGNGKRFQMEITSNGLYV